MSKGHGHGEGAPHHNHILHLPQARSLLGLQLCICRMIARHTPPQTLHLPLERN